jgi:protein disulfide-isomerase
MGAQGVPFFVMDGKYGVAGAQPAQAFLQTLEKSYSEWEKEHPSVTLSTLSGEVCTPDGDCK